MVVGDFAQGTQVAVIGGGTGGYVAAIRAAQMGLEVTLVEKDLLGGVCLNWGCIPSKAMIHVGDLKEEIERAEKIGIKVESPSVDLQKVVEWKDGVVERLRNGVQTLLSKNEVTVVRGTAKLTGKASFEVDGPDGHQRFEFQHCILATGSSAAGIPGMPRDGQTVIISDDAVGLTELPERFVVIGAGAVGLEMGMVFAKLGSKVTILEAMDDLLPMLDPDIAPVIQRSLRRHKIKLILGAKVKGMEKTDDAAVLTYETADGEQTVDADRILVAIGRRPNTAGIGLDEAGVETDDKGFVKVDERMQTNIPNVYAIGDMVAGPMLAHRASYQGKIAAEVIAGEPSAFEGVSVPSVIFSDPEIATVGLTAKEAEVQGINAKEGVFPFKALGRAATLGGAGDGFTKVVTDADSGIVLGVHIIGPSASDLISEGALAVASASHFDDLALTIHPHPTLPESIEEAAEQVENKAIHIFNPGKSEK